MQKRIREKSRECHNHKPQPFPDPKRKRKPTNPNKHKSNKRTKSTKISSLFPKRGNRNTKRTEKHKNKMTHGKTYNKSPRRINHKATNSKTNTGTTFIYNLHIMIRKQAKFQKNPIKDVGGVVDTSFKNCCFSVHKGCNYVRNNWIKSSIPKVHPHIKKEEKIFKISEVSDKICWRHLGHKMCDGHTDG